MYNLDIALENLDIALEKLDTSHIVSEDIAMEGIGTSIRSFGNSIKNIFSLKKPKSENEENVQVSTREKRFMTIEPDKIDEYVYKKRKKWVDDMMDFFVKAYKRINQRDCIPLTISFSTITDQNDFDPSFLNPITFRKYHWLFYISVITKDGQHAYIPLSNQSPMYINADSQLKRQFDKFYAETSREMLDVIVAFNLLDDDDPRKTRSEFAPSISHNACGITVSAAIEHEWLEDGGIQCRMLGANIDILKRFTYDQLDKESYYLDNMMYNEAYIKNKKYITQMFNK